jgi:hypothetical protein
MSIIKQLVGSQSGLLLGLIADTPPTAPEAVALRTRFGELNDDPRWDKWDNWNNWGAFYNYIR